MSAPKKRPAWKRALRPYYEKPLECYLDLVYRRYFLSAVIRNRGVQRALFYPERPRFVHCASRICWILGYRVTTDPAAPVAVSFSFKDVTWKQPDAVALQLSREREMINIGCVDVSKSAVERAHVKVFGYGCIVNPREHKGPLVRKSEVNGVHDGLIVQAPLTPQPGFVYQPFIDTLNADGLYPNLRVPVMRDRIPFLYSLLREPEDPFNSQVASAVHETDEMLSRDEQRRIVELAAEMGVDFGELDVLRDNADGRIYVLDVADTPTGPARTLTRRQRMTVMIRLAKAFKAEFVDSPAEPPLSADRALTRTLK